MLFIIINQLNPLLLKPSILPKGLTYLLPQQTVNSYVPKSYRTDCKKIKDIEYVEQRENECEEVTE